MATTSVKEAVTDVEERTQSPFLRRVRICGYKSIAFCDVTLEPLTILVGRNASGKSNFLDALGFLRDALEEGVNSALQRHGGAAVFSQGMNTNRLAFEVQTEFSSYHPMQCQAVYRVILTLSSRKQLEVEEEVLQLDDLTHGQSCGFTAVPGKVAWKGLESFQEGRYQRVSEEQLVAKARNVNYPSLFAQHRPDRLLLGVIGSQPFIDLAGGLRSIGCFNFHPDSIRELQQSIGSPELKRDGSNLARAIEGLKEIDESDLSRVKAYLAGIVPDIAGFDVVQLGDYETIRFRLHSTTGAKGLEFNASSMSDGTLRTLAALVAAYQIVLPHGYPSLVAIEEPETALHPAAMRALVDALDEATGRTQILLTTHSTELLDNPTIRPENIRVVELIDGQTVIAPVDEASREIVRQKLDTLGGLERQNQLSPDPDDLERQHLLKRSAQEAPA